MRRLVFRWRTVFAMLAAFVAVMAAPGAASAADSIAVQRFAADSGDRCRYGATDGTLSWRWTSIGPAEPAAVAYGVDVAGTVVDRPAPSTEIVCRDDQFYSVALFVLYSRNTIIDWQAVRADNAAQRFAFTLGLNATRTGVDALVVQVCRYQLSGPGISYCGQAQTYAPVIT